MTGNFGLDAAALGVSLFNTMLLLWLGIVVAANADRQRGGIWLVGGGLLSAAAFFIVHSAILGRGVREVSPDLDWLWRAGWLPIIAAALAWYVVMVWYTGKVRLPGLALAVGGALLLWGLILLTDALPTFSLVLPTGRPESLSAPATPVFIAVYALYNVLCIGLALYALRHAEPSARFMGDLARRRARPWFVAASLLLLLVSFLVSAFVVTLYALDGSSTPPREDQLLLTLTAFDLVVDLMLAGTVVLTGKAIVSYEIFTGKSLPRSGFFRQWRRVVILAAGYSTVLAAAITWQVRPIYTLLLATLVIVIFYALLSVRLFGEREALMQQLRPFLTAPNESSNLRGLRREASLQRGSLRDLEGFELQSSELDPQAPFRALCENLLNARLAYLVPLGSVSTLFGGALAYPSGGEPLVRSLTRLPSYLNAPDVMIVRIPPHEFNDAVWAVPLWNERGLNGALLLGEKRDAGLYTQEEIEIARATCERLIEMHARAEVTRRLIRLQRQRLSEMQVMDRRARHVLHDNVLPLLHTVLLNLNASSTAIPADGSAPVSEPLAQLSEVHRQLSELLREMPIPGAPEVERHGILGALRRTLEQELPDTFDSVSWHVQPEVEARARTCAGLYAEILFYAAREAMRNAARHGRGGDPARALALSITARWADGLEIVIEDDGVGYSTAAGETEGNGQGLVLHGAMMATIGGALTVQPAGEGGCTAVHLFLPAAAWTS